MKKLKLAKDVSLPLDAITQKFAFLGKSGSGKTYASGKFAELLLEEKAQVIIIDTIGNWWALRLAADGKKKGFDIPVIGGYHADIPLESTGGKLIADLIAENGASLILDISEFTGGETSRFITDFATQLLQKKKSFISPLMIIWEECQDIVPQNPMGAEKFTLGAVNKLIKKGRNYGIGTTLISQRPQAVNKEVLNQTECMVVFQMTAPHERKAVEEWMKDKSLDRNPLEELPKLKTGECFIWSPSWLEIYTRTHILPKNTFDASKTPTFGSNLRITQQLAPINLDELDLRMKATIEKAKANDPNVLKKRIQDLEKELRGKTDTTELKKLQSENDSLKQSLSAVSLWLHSMPRSITLETGYVTTAPSVITKPKQNIEIPKADLSPHDFNLSGPQRKILTALAQQNRPLQKKQIAIYAGYAVNGGAFNNPISQLRTSGLIEGKESISITPAGLSALGNFEKLPIGSGLQDYWLSHLPGPHAKLLKALIEQYPNAVTKEQLADLTGYASNGGAFNNPISRLRTLELIEGKQELRASEFLFD